MDRKSSPRYPNPKPSLGPSKLMVAFHFLRALSLVHQTTPSSSRTHRGRRIQRAAYASMAYSAGPRRAWSRALLHKLHYRRRGRRLGAVVPRRLSNSSIAGLNRATRELNPAQALRRLVPGGTGMDYCSLLEETADYIKCLTTQVQLMQNIVDSTSPCGR